jgi:hypothetical protein
MPEYRASAYLNIALHALNIAHHALNIALDALNIALDALNLTFMPVSDPVCRSDFFPARCYQS